MELARTGSTLPTDIECPSSPFLAIKAAPIDQRAEQTRTEQIAVLDAELNAELGKFDELLLREQERIKTTAPLSAKDNAGQTNGSDTGENTTYAGNSVNEQPPRASDEETDSGAAGGADRPNRTVSKAPPPGIPDGSDDDVVARQLREAAEKESDPELRKKLWEEYKKYKQGTR